MNKAEKSAAIFIFVTVNDASKKATVSQKTLWAKEKMTKEKKMQENVICMVILRAVYCYMDYDFDRHEQCYEF